MSQFLLVIAFIFATIAIYFSIKYRYRFQYDNAIGKLSSNRIGQGELLLFKTKLYNRKRFQINDEEIKYLINTFPDNKYKYIILKNILHDYKKYHHNRHRILNLAEMVPPDKRKIIISDEEVNNIYGSFLQEGIQKGDLFQAQKYARKLGRELVASELQTIIQLHPYGESAREASKLLDKYYQ